MAPGSPRRAGSKWHGLGWDLLGIRTERSEVLQLPETACGESTTPPGHPSAAQYGVMAIRKPGRILFGRLGDMLCALLGYGKLRGGGLIRVYHGLIHMRVGHPHVHGSEQEAGRGTQQRWALAGREGEETEL